MLKNWAYMLLLSLLPLCAMANDDDLEYKLEVGGGLGPCFYLGDANKTPFGHMSLMGGVMVRRTFNPRMVLKTNLAAGGVRGNSKGIFIPTDAYTPGAEGGVPTSVSFKRSVMDLGAQFEFNFWGYGMDTGYKGFSRITPYITLGAGLTMIMGGGGFNAGMNFPMGVGVKYKARPRVNIGAEWTFRYTTSDKLDWRKSAPQLSEPYNTESTFFKNKDSYSFFWLFITYDMCPKLRRCNN